MNFPSNNLSPFHIDVLQHTHLGQICGTEEVFRNRYKILRMLGRGGFGVTFLAKDIYLPSQPLCVIKQLCPKFTDLPALESARERFEREAKTLSLLGSHSQIPRLLDYFVIDGEFYLVQEYVRGYTLARLIRRVGPLSELGLRKFLEEILPLLKYIHSNRVIHRDIKPQNILRCQDDGRLVLIDFGAVKEIAQMGDTSEKCATTNFIGTVGFAPPEQFSLRPTYASDIYALGVTCLYLLTAKPPLDFTSDRRTGEIAWRQEVRVSEVLGQILDKMLKTAVGSRYQSVDAILKDLQEGLSLDNLASCMTIQTPQEKESKSDRPKESDRNPYNRMAVGIRDWKARLQAKQQRDRTKRMHEMLRNSSSGI